MITIIRTDGMLLVGDMEMNRLKEPRALMITPDGKNVYFAELIGRPTELYFDAPAALRYEPHEQGLIDKYREVVSGIVIARPQNVIDIGGIK